MAARGTLLLVADSLCTKPFRHEPVGGALSVSWSIISGGQTGVDRAALDAAMELGIPHGGWCPRGRRAEDGRIAACYQLRETLERDYWIRTERNVLDSQATLILYRGRISGGTELTYRMTKKHDRPCTCIDLNAAPGPGLEGVLDGALAWWLCHAAQVMNVAGPRESTAPGIYGQARHFLLSLFSRLLRHPDLAI